MKRHVKVSVCLVTYSTSRNVTYAYVKVVALGGVCILDIALVL